MSEQNAIDDGLEDLSHIHEKFEREFEEALNSLDTEKGLSIPHVDPAAVSIPSRSAGEADDEEGDVEFLIKEARSLEVRGSHVRYVV
jgi:hypothetical protein